MNVFKYTAQKGDGKKYERTIEAKDRFEVYSLVRKEGAKILSVEKISPHFAFLKPERLNNLFATVKDIEKITFARNLATMIKAGLPLTRAIGVMERQTTNTYFKSVLEAVNRSVVNGNSFHNAVAEFPGVFSSLLVSMIKAGEESGKLAEALLVTTRQMEESYDLKRKVRGALIYPAIIMLAMVGIGVLMLIYVVPTLSSTFAELGADLPATTRGIIWISDFLVNNIVISLLLLTLFATITTAFLRTKAGKRGFDFFILHIPIISNIVKEVNSARTTRTLSSLLASGVGMIEGITITRDVVQNSYYKEVLDSAVKNVQDGKPIADSFISSSDLYPVMVGDMIAVGEETGQLSSMLLEIADFYEKDVAQQTKNLSTVIEPLLMIVIGVVVGFFAISMITPIYSISNSI